MSPAPREARPKSAGVQADRQHGQASVGPRENQSRGSRSTMPHPSGPRPREWREGPYERSGRGARETTGTRLGRAAETSGRGRACEESWKTVEIKMSAANPGGAGSNSRPGSRNRPPRARQDESYAPTLVFDQPSREQRHQERTEPSARQGVPDAIPRLRSNQGCTAATAGV